STGWSSPPSHRMLRSWPGACHCCGRVSAVCGWRCSRGGSAQRQFSRLTIRVWLQPSNARGCMRLLEFALALLVVVAALLRLNPAPTPPQPRLETAEGESFAAYQAAEQQRLTSYTWVDRQSGTVSIPIARAMDLVAQRGLPARPAVNARDNGTSQPSSASSG